MQESSKFSNKYLSDADPTQTVLWYQNDVKHDCVRVSEISDVITVATFHHLYDFE